MKSLFINLNPKSFEVNGIVPEVTPHFGQFLNRYQKLIGNHLNHIWDKVEYVDNPEQGAWFWEADEDVNPDVLTQTQEELEFAAEQA